jgi:hypothetical protein
VDPRRRTTIKAIAGLSLGARYGQIEPAWGQSGGGDLIVFLPGIMGSVLQKNGRDVWAMTPRSVISALASAGRNIKDLQLAEDPPDVENLGDGVVATALIPDIHLIPGLWKIDGYSGVMAALSRRVRIQPNVNYIEFAYDWRRDNRVAARKLAQEVPKWLGRWRIASGNPQAKVVFIGHSMGGLIVRYYLECLEGWRYARKLITFGTPFRGSLNALAFLSRGFNPTFAGLEIANLSALVRSFTSVYQLLPRYPCVEDSQGVLKRPSELKNLPNVDHQKTVGAMSFHQELERAICANATAKGYVPYGLHPVIGVDQRTAQSARLMEGTLQVFDNIHRNDPGGDGVVPRPSAVPLGCRADDDRRGFEGAVHVSGLHASLQNLPAVITQVSYVLAEPNFEAYRLKGRLRLMVEDAYPMNLEVKVQCSTIDDSLASEASLILQDTSTAQLISQQSVSISTGETKTVSLGRLPIGAYRVMLKATGHGDEGSGPLSDVFLVSR